MLSRRSIVRPEEFRRAGPSTFDDVASSSSRGIVRPTFTLGFDAVVLKSGWEIDSSIIVREALAGICGVGVAVAMTAVTYFVKSIQCMHS